MANNARNGHFYELSDQVEDYLEYSRNAEEPGLVIIFNFNKYLNGNQNERKGSIRDVNELIICFQRLCFNVEKRFIFQNLTAEQIKSKIKEIKDGNLEKYNCLVVIFSSHGEQGNKIHAYDTTLTTDDIIDPFSNEEALQGKPKLFIFQTCKGSEASAKMSNVVMPIVPLPTFSKDLPRDIIIAFSSTEGNASFRDMNLGSWFLQEICRNFNTYARRDDVVNLLIRVSKCVSSNYKHGNSRQMPLFISTLTKKFYLTRSRNRNLMLDAIEKNKACLEDIQNMIDLAT